MTFVDRARFLAAAFAGVAALVGCMPGPGHPGASIVGAWRSQVQFTSGPFATTRDLEFMYVVHADGTLTESSNYDAAPPVPPAYGVWRETSPGNYQAHYEFYPTKAPETGASLTGGWGPVGRGILEESISLAPDGHSFTSTLHLQILDASGQPTSDSGEARTRAVRISFPAG